MKKLFWILFLVSQVAFANPPVFTLTPVIVPPTTIVNGQTVNASYLVTNTTPYTLVKNGLRFAPEGLTPLGVKQVLGPGAICSDPFTLGPGASCTLNLTITATSANYKAMTGPEVCNLKAHPAHCSVPAAGSQLNVQAGFPIVLASGASGNSTPLLIQTLDHGVSWKLSNLPPVPSSLIGNPSCSFEFCLAIVNPISTPPSNLVYTVNGGTTWQYLSSISFASGENVQNLNGVTACTQDPLGMCLVWALDISKTHFVSVQYTASTPAWTLVDIYTPIGTPFLGQAACGSSFCVAGGQDGTAGFLFQSQNASTWSPVTVFINGPGPGNALPAQSALYAVGCDGDLCVYFGQNQTGPSPHNLFTLTTHDGGTSWTYLDLGTGGGQTAVSVSCNEAVGLCGAIALDTGSHPYAYTTVDGGLTWNQHMLSASGAGSAAITCNQYLCLASYGASNLSQFTLSGGMWTTVPVPAPVGGTPVIIIVECFDQYCIAGGFSLSSMPVQPNALLVQTYNAGPGTPTFHLVDLSSDPTIPILNSVIAWGGSTGLLKKSFHTELDFFQMR